MITEEERKHRARLRNKKYKQSEKYKVRYQQILKEMKRIKESKIPKTTITISRFIWTDNGIIELK